MTQAIEALKSAAIGGNVMAWAALGEAYLHGDGVEQSFVEAVAAFEHGAMAGCPVSANALSVLCFEGLGCECDFERALLLAGLACQKLPKARGNFTRIANSASREARDRVASLLAGPSEAVLSALRSANVWATQELSHV